MPLTDKQKDNAQKQIKSKRIHALTVKFIRMPADKDMKFNNKGSLAEAERLIQSMRVKLSRLRDSVKQRGTRRLADFKMRLNSIVYNETDNECIIILTKTAPIAKIEQQIEDIFNDD